MVTRQTYDREAIIAQVQVWLEKGTDPRVIRDKLTRSYNMPTGTAYGFYREAAVRRKVRRA